MDAIGPPRHVSGSTNASPPVRSAWTSTAPGDPSSSTGHENEPGQAMMDRGTGMMGNR